MTVKSFLRSLANYGFGPLDLTLERKSVLEHKISTLQNRYVMRPTLFECALAGKETPVVLDIGASLGNKIQHVLEICPKAYVFAFKPQPEQIRRIQERFRSNRRVRAYACGGRE